VVRASKARPGFGDSCHPRGLTNLTTLSTRFRFVFRSLLSLAIDATLAEHGLRGIPRLLRSLSGLRRTDVVELQVHYVHRHVAIMPVRFSASEMTTKRFSFCALSSCR
jgi:hypothetical protein